MSARTQSDHQIDVDASRMVLDTIAITPMRADDRSFVFNSWLRSFKRSDFARSMDAETYFALQHRRVELLLKESRVLVARDREDPDLIRGWLCSDQEHGRWIHHYCFVKQAFRGFGIATELVRVDLASRGLSVQGAAFTHLRLPGSLSLIKRGATLVELS